MGLRINTNVLALQSQNSLKKSNAKLASSLQKLSTGLRINKGSDDVVGLLKSESLRSQIRGIGVAENNISNASSLLGVAEGSLAELTSIAQEIREKTVQAADDSISSADRSNLTTAINDLRNEFSRLSQGSEFDGTKLLDGTFTSKSFQIGPNNGDTLSFSLSDTRATAIGQIAIYTTTEVSTVVSTSALLDLAAPSGITINGVSTGTNSADGVSNADTSDSAIAYVNAINAISGQTGVTAEVEANIWTLDYTSDGGFTTGGFLVINGSTVDISGVTNATVNDTNASTLATAINNLSTTTGVTASVDTANNDIILTASDGRNIDYSVSRGVTANNNAAAFGFDVAETATGVGFGIQRGTFKLYSDEAFTIAGASDEFGSSGADATHSVSTSNVLSTLDVSSASNASTGIFIMDNVIRQLQARRADVGSKVIRFGIALGELGARKENLSSAESTIRDTDVAAETASLTAAQILQQAGVTVLARANAVPQIALSLLQG